MNELIYNKLPSKPGIYFFKDKFGKIIYIGKSINLKNRVKSYFCQQNLGFKTKKMVASVADIGWQICQSEFNALLLEAKLINQHQPKYNVKAKDDKSFLKVAITKEDYPRLYTTRKINPKDWFFGPFTASSQVKRALRLIRNIFPFRSCKKLPKKPCLYYHLKLCPGCCLGTGKKKYQQTILKILRLLNGDNKGLLKQLKKEMKQASKKQEYEKAAAIKQQINSLDFLISHWQNLDNQSLGLDLLIDQKQKTSKEIKKIFPLIKVIKRIEAYDVSNLFGQKATGSMVVFKNFMPAKSDYRRFKIKTVPKPDDIEMIREIIKRRLKHHNWPYPQLIVVDGGKGQVGAVISELGKNNLLRKIFVLGLAKKEEIIIKPNIKNKIIFSWQEIKLAKNSLLLKLLQNLRNEAHRFAKKYHLYLRQKLLGINPCKG